MMDKINSLKLIAKGTIDVPEPLLEYAGIQRGPDVLPVMFKMVHASKNANMDKFTEDELEKALASVENKALNWEHTDEFIGHIKKAYLVKTDGKEVKTIVASNKDVLEGTNLLKNEEGEPSYIIAIGLVWKHRKSLRDKTIKMENRSKAGTLAWSMETFFNTWECDECHMVFANEDEECTHMKNRFMNGTGRILKGLNFVGAGVVEDPADKQATNIAIGMDSNSVEAISVLNAIALNTGTETKKEEVKMAFKTFETEIELKQFVDETFASLKTSLETELANSKKEVEDFKGEIASLKQMLSDKEVLAKNLADELSNMKALEKQKLGEARLAELVSAGFSVPDEAKSAFAKDFADKTEEIWNIFKKSILASIVKPSANAATVPQTLTEREPEKFATASVDVNKNESSALDRILSRRTKRE